MMNILLTRWLGDQSCDYFPCHARQFCGMSSKFLTKVLYQHLLKYVLLKPTVSLQFFSNG
jgi:hypothetical protein